MKLKKFPFEPIRFEEYYTKDILNDAYDFYQEQVKNAIKNSQQAALNIVNSYGAPEICPALHDKVFWLGRQLEKAEKENEQLRLIANEAIGPKLVDKLLEN